MLKPYFRLIFPNKLMAAVLITLQCTYKCSYCPYCSKDSDMQSKFPKSCEKSGKEWVEALEKLPPTSFYFCGGEPFFYKDLPYIINNMPEKHSVLGVVTNASMPLETYKKVNKKIYLNVSFHREYVSEDEFIKKVLELKKYFYLCVNIVATEENYEFIKNNIKIFKDNGIAFHIDALIDKASKPHEYTEEYEKLINKYAEKSRNIQTEKFLYQKSPKLCSAGKNYYNLLPNGDAVTCSRAIDYKYSPFVKRDDNPVYELGNIFDGSFKLKPEEFVCSYECISHCDRDYAKITPVKRKH